MDTYSQRGVSAAKSDVHFAIRHLDKGLYPHAFCKILPDLLGGDEAYCTLMHADGAGTKSSLAYMYWRETGDLSVWRGIAQDGIVMNTDDMLCAGATDGFVMSSTIGRNAFHIPKEVLAEILMGSEEVFEMLRAHGVSILNAGGETADVGDLVRTLIFDATMTCRFPRKDVIANEKIAAGSVIVGLASYGQATYEAAYNSGIGSNGLTNGRHDTLHSDYRSRYPESFDQVNVPENLAYSGKFHLTDTFEDAPLNVGKLLLSPTRTYLPVVQRVFAQFRDQIHGMIHCTGGGQTKCLKFVENLHIVKDNLLPVPHVFRMIQQASGANWQDMYRIFNMGHRLEIYTDAATADAIIGIAAEFKIDAQIIGTCHAAAENHLTLHSPYGVFEYA